MLASKLAGVMRAFFWHPYDRQRLELIARRSQFGFVVQVSKETE
jgi:hypothetical protein